MNGFGSVKEWITKCLKTKSKTDGIVLLLIGVLVLIVLIPTGENTGAKKDSKQSEKQELSTLDSRQTQSDAEYVHTLEEQLKEMIQSMDGAGKTRVMVTLADDGSTYLDKNVKTQEKMREETTVVYDVGDASEPYVIRRERPRVEGVVVVAQGGDRPGVITEITDAMQSLFGLEAHKVKVVKMSVQEE